MEIKKLKDIKRQYLIGALILGVILLLAPNFVEISKDGKLKKEETTESVDNSPYTNLESRLEKIVEKIDGITDATVFITYENNGVKRHAYNTKDDAVTEKNSVTVKKENMAVMEKESSKESPVLIEETMPQVRGVLIVASGIENTNKNEEITEAVSAVLGVPVHKVKVLSSN